MTLISLAITVAYMYILKWITKPVLFISLFLILATGVGCTVWNFMTAASLPEGDDKDYANAFGWVCAVFTVLYIIFLCCNYKNIMIGADIIGCAGDFVAKTPQIMVTPFLSYFSMIPILIWFIFTNIFLYASGTPKYVEDKMFADLEGSKQANWMFWIFLFGFFWIIAFFIGIQ